MSYSPLLNCSYWSLPVWVEWIEVQKFKDVMTTIKGLYPFGQSGLKFLCNKKALNNEWSLPVWVEWIEVYCEMTS